MRLSFTLQGEPAFRPLSRVSYLLFPAASSTSYHHSPDLDHSILQTVNFAAYPSLR